MADPIMLEALNLTKRFRTLQAPMTSISELHSKVFSALPKRAGESTSMTRMIRTTRSTSGEIPLGQPLKSVERGLLAICPQDIVVWSDLTCQQNLALMRNLCDHRRNPKAILKTASKIFCVAWRSRGGWVITLFPRALTLVPQAHRSATMKNKE